MGKHFLDGKGAALTQGVERRYKRIGNLDFDCASHCVYSLSVHVVFCTKFRRKILDNLSFLRETFLSIAADIGCSIVEFGGETDHVHLLLKYPPTASLSAVVGTLKSRSASAYLNRFGSFYWGRHNRTLWSSGFFLCSAGGVTLETLRAYIEQQGLANPD